VLKLATYKKETVAAVASANNWFVAICMKIQVEIYMAYTEFGL
jgi:hypothetical protein